MVAIHTYKIDILITRPTEKEVLFTLHGIHLRGNGIDKLVYTFCITEIIDCKLPKTDKLRLRSATFFPTMTKSVYAHGKDGK